MKRKKLTLSEKKVLYGRYRQDKKQGMSDQGIAEALGLDVDCKLMMLFKAADAVKRGRDGI